MDPAFHGALSQRRLLRRRKKAAGDAAAGRCSRRSTPSSTKPIPVSTSTRSKTSATSIGALRASDEGRDSGFLDHHALSAHPAVHRSRRRARHDRRTHRQDRRRGTRRPHRTRRLRHDARRDRRDCLALLARSADPQFADGIDGSGRRDRSPPARARALAATHSFDDALRPREAAARFWRRSISRRSIVAGRRARRPQQPKMAARTRNTRPIACDLATAAREHADLLARAFGAGRRAQGTKFGALASAFAQLRRVRIRAGRRAADEPIVIAYAARRRRDGLSRTSSVLGRSARASRMIEQHSATADGSSAASPRSSPRRTRKRDCTRAVSSAGRRARRLASRARSAGQATRGSRGRRRTRRRSLRVTSIDVIDRAARREAQIQRSSSHRLAARRLLRRVDHRAANRTSHTLVKSPQRDRGQARYLGNIRIAADAHGRTRRCATTRCCSPRTRTSIPFPRSRLRPTTSKRITARPSARSTTSRSST